MRANLCRLSGMTLIEIVIALVVVGIMLTFGVPAIAGLSENGNRKVAIARCESLFAGQQLYKNRVSNASAVYGTYTTQSGRYSLIKAYVPGAPSSIDDYTPDGFTIILQASLDAKPVLQAKISGPFVTVITY